MSKFTLTKLAPGAKAAAPAAKLKKGDAAPGTFNIQVGQGDTFTVFGVSAANPQVDISAVASISATSDNPAVLTVTTSGVGGQVKAVSAGTATLTIVATWNDGSVGPFTATVLVTVVVNPNTVTGLEVQWGTPA